MVVWRLKSCPHCAAGDTFIDRDIEGWYQECLQCGHRRDLPGVSRQVTAAPKTGTKEHAR